MTTPKRLPSLVACGAMSVLAALPLPAQQTTPPPNAPRAISLGDTLGAAFAVGDSATGTATPADFDFLVGMWHFRFQQRRPDGTFYPAFTGHWSAEKKRVANGFLEDHFRSDSPGATIENGTWTYRVFNPQRKLWEMQGVNSENGSWAPGLCWSDGTNRYLVQHYGSSMMRIRYSSIAANTFLWRADKSDDGGKTWHLDWWTMEAQRMGK